MAQRPPQGERPRRALPQGVVPLRLLVHFQTSDRALVQVTDARREGQRLIGAGTRAIDLSNPAGEIELFDPMTGAPLNERVTVAHVLAVLHSLARRIP